MFECHAKICSTPIIPPSIAAPVTLISNDSPGCLNVMILGKSITNAVSAVVDRKAVSSELKNITCPTLILVGTQDLATPPEKAELIHSKIKDSTLTYIDGGGHTSSIEEPEKYNREIEHFLESIVQ